MDNFNYKQCPKCKSVNTYWSQDRFSDNRTCAECEYSWDPTVERIRLLEKEREREKLIVADNDK